MKGKQLALGLGNASLPIVPRETVREALGLTSLGRVSYHQDFNLLDSFEYLANYVYQNRPSTLNMNSKAVKLLVSLLNYPRSSHDFEWVKEIREVDIPSFIPASSGSKFYKIIPTVPDKYVKLLVLTTGTNYLKYSGDIRMLNAKGQRRFVRFCYISESQLLGYSVLFKNILKVYDLQEGTLTFSKAELRRILSLLIQRKYAAKGYSTLFDKYKDGDLPLATFKLKYPKRNTDSWITLRVHNNILKFLRDYIRNISVQIAQERYESVKEQYGEENIGFNKSKKKILKVEQLSQYFESIQLDGETNKELLDLFVTEASKAMPYLPIGSRRPKVGLYGTNTKGKFGTYTSQNNQIVLALPNTNQIAAFSRAGLHSFMHEYGSYLDYMYAENQLSTGEDFLPILSEYFKLLNKHNTRLTDTQAPTTIFANAFELYIDNKGLQTQLKKPHADYAYDLAYRYVSKDLMDKIDTYFDDLFASSKIAQIPKAEVPSN